MRTDKLNYYLPPDLIAQQPLRIRSDSRLLIFNRSSKDIVDSRFNNIGNFLLPGDCLVLNDTKVLSARFFGRRSSGGKLEGLFLSQSSPGVWEVMLKGARKVIPGEVICMEDKTGDDFCEAKVLDKMGYGRFLLKLNIDSDIETILEKTGFPPLPPYIKRDMDINQAAIDAQRYQTVYAHKAGAVAAPTAGLHLTNKLIERLKNKQVTFAYITLHVGAGTFKPITTENLEDHKIHQEWFQIDEENARIINTAKKNGGRIIAIGTTSVRTLETIAVGSRVEAVSGTTELFIKPGYKFKMVDAMITNFHLPRSTLLALVAVFAGLEDTLQVYRHAIKQQYRFYSYGDAMLII